jgi:hypothetical protein
MTLIIELKYEELPVNRLLYTRPILYRACVYQLYYRHPWTNEEDKDQHHPKFRVRLKWEKEEDKGKNN